MRSNNTANRHQSGTQTRRHIEDEDLLHRGRRNTYAEASVVTATAIPVESSQQQRHTYDGSGSGSTYNDNNSDHDGSVQSTIG